MCPRAAPPAPPPGNRPPGAPASAAGPLCPHRRRPVFAAPPPGPARLRPAGSRRRARARRAPRRPAAAPPARKKKRAARAAPPAVPAPRPPAERPAPPRGNQIPGRGLQETAAPSRVNFREIRDPGVTPQKSKNARKNPAKKRKAAAHADRCLKWLDKLPHHAEVVFFRIEYGQYADDLLRFINAVEDQIILMQDVAKVKATQNAVFR